MAKKFLWVLLGGALLAALILFQGGPAVTAKDALDEGGVTQMLKNQEKILQGIEEIKAELVKIRIRTN